MITASDQHFKVNELRQNLKNPIEIRKIKTQYCNFMVDLDPFTLDLKQCDDLNFFYSTL